MVIIKDADHEDALEMYIICDDDMISLICDVRLFMIMINNINDENDDIDDDEKEKQYHDHDDVLLIHSPCVSSLTTFDTSELTEG